MRSRLRVLYVSPEITPLAKSGEMADVAASLPKFLSALGIDISLIMPMYRTPVIESLSKDLVEPDLSVPLGQETVKGRIFKSALGSLPLYLVDSPKYFWRESVYGTGKEEYLDNDERFVFFNRAVVEFMHKAGLVVDIIHCNNWPTALIPVFLRTLYRKRKPFEGTRTVLTLHNIAYQGAFPPETLLLTGLSWDYFTHQNLAQNGKFNFLKAGIIYSDLLTTVSSAYRRQILSEKHGFGLGKILKNRSDTLFSIRNGIDYEVWNPGTDPYIAVRYSSSDLRPKKICKEDLIREFGLNMSRDDPLIGVFAYFAQPKGFDILIDSVDPLMKKKVGLVVLGQGEDRYLNELKSIQSRYLGRVGVRTGVQPALSHKVVAGADIFLIPSMFEPCGLNQLYSFRYGTVPVARATGGLGETIKPFDEKTMKGNGFTFREYSSQAMVAAIETALRHYGNPDVWERIMRAGLEENFSWERSAKRYAKIYRMIKPSNGGGRVVRKHHQRHRR